MKNTLKISAALLISLFLLSCTPMEEKKGVITIHNNSTDAVSDVTVKYTSSEKEAVIGKLNATGTYHYDINYLDSEDSIHISYVDKDQKHHTISAVPYAASYDKQHYTVTIE